MGCGASSGVAGAAALALALAACSPASDNGADSGGAVTIDADHSVGAMEKFDVGTTFKASEPVKFSLMYRDHPAYPVQNDWSVFRHLADDHNVTFKRTDIPMSDFEEKKALLIGSGEATDIISVSYSGSETKFVSGGAILPVSDYLDYLPNFKDKLKKWDLQEDFDNTRQEDGKVYLLPGLRETPNIEYSVLRYLAAARVAFSGSARSSIYQSCCRPFSSAVPRMNCHMPLALARDSAFGLKALSMSGT